MFKIQAKIKNLQGFYKQIKGFDDKVDRAAQASVRIEGYRLKTSLEQYILRGPEGPPMREISQLSRQYQAAFGSKLWSKTGFPRPGMSDPALRAMAIPVRYEAKKMGDNLRVRVGVVKNKSVSSSWRKILHKQQTGFQISLTQELREYFANLGVFFKKEKQSLTVPPRKIIGPFWRKQQNVAYANIKRNFETKMAGKYV